MSHNITYGYNQIIKDHYGSILRRKLYVCAVFIASFAAITAALSLEKISLEIELTGEQQLRENNEELTLQIRQIKQNDVSILLKDCVDRTSLFGALFD